MILRCIANGIKNQDWFVVLIEIFIVVIGIYIGLQVDDWNKARKDRSEEVRILQQLVVEVEAAIKAKEVDLSEAREDQVFLIEAIVVIQEDRAGDEFTTEQCGAVWQSHIMSRNFIGLLTYEELALSGKLGLLSNPALRSALIAYQNQAELDNELQGFIQLDIVNVVDVYGDLLPRQLDLETLEPMVDCQLKDIRKNQTFRNNLQSNLGRAIGLNGRMENEITMLRDILEMIEGGEK